MIYDIPTFIILYSILYRYLFPRFFSFYVIKNLRINLINTINFLKKLLYVSVIFVYVFLTTYRSDQSKYSIKTEQHPGSLEEKTMVISHELFHYLTSQIRDTPYPGIETYTQYILTRSQIKQAIGIKSLRSDFGPVMNDILSFNFHIEIPPCPNIITPKNSVFVAVISAPKYFDKRNVIRQTWLHQMEKMFEFGAQISLHSFAFVVGFPDNKETQMQIELESNLFGDILQIEMIDSYENLTQKVVGLLKWVNDHCSQVDFVFNVDDDVYVNVRNLMTIINSFDSSDPIVYGTAADGVVRREGKFNISFEDWPWSNYPIYCMGASLLLPGSTIKPLLAASQTTPYFPFEDTYLTGLCTSRAGIKVRFSDRMLVNFSKVTHFYFPLPQPCQVYRSITWLTDSAEALNKSHWATNNFYNNVTKCIIKDIHGVKITINPIAFPDFPFSE